MNDLFNNLRQHLFDSSSIFYRLAPALASFTAVCVLLWFVRWFLFMRKPDQDKNQKFSKQLVMLALSFLGFFIILFALPLNPDTKGHLFSLSGILFTGIIAISSTTFAANIMAGFMLRLISSFKIGDFILIEGFFGRVSERGLTHLEIQGEDRGLTTLSNLFVVTHPYTVTRNSGTIISANLSLGYDLAHSKIEPLLLEAAIQAGLSDPFVQIKELGDFSITYRIAGLLSDVNQIITTRSNLRKQVLDTLHANQVEIVSPHFMNQRRLETNVKIWPPSCTLPGAFTREETNPEKVIFDKAEEAVNLETLEREKEELTQFLSESKKASEKEQTDLSTGPEQEIQQAKQRIEEIEQEQAALKKHIEGP